MYQKDLHLHRHPKMVSYFLSIHYHKDCNAIKDFWSSDKFDKTIIKKIFVWCTPTHIFQGG